MKKILSLILIVFVFNCSFAQNVTINPTGITPAPSGVSYPRITYPAILALSNPQAGDLAYDITYNCLRVYVGSQWLRIVTDTFPNAPGGTAFSLNISFSFIESDALGDIYISGSFKESVNLAGTIITSVGDNDFFLAKFSSTGILAWVRTAGSNAGDGPSAVTIDSNGDIVITGTFYDTINFSGTILPYSGSCNMFFVKYTSAGTLVWAKSSSGTNISLGRGITTDASGDIFITGYFFGTVTFTTAGSNIILSTGGSPDDAFVLKLNSSGVVQWVKSIAGISQIQGKDIHVYGNEVFVAGDFSGNAIFSSAFLLSSNSGSGDVFLAKYNKNTGDIIQVVSLGGSQGEGGAKFEMTSTGEIVLAVSAFGPITLLGNTYTPVGSSDCLYVKFNSSLVLLWAKMFGGSSPDDIFDIKLDASNNIYFIGRFFGTINTSLGMFTSAGDSDVFIGKASTEGELIWFNKYGASLMDSGARLSVKNGLFATGFFNGTVSFGSSVLTSAATGSGFIMKLAE